MRNKRYSLALILSALACFAASCISYHYYALGRLDRGMERHARVVAKNLWVLDYVGPIEYLTLAAERDGLESIQVFSSDIPDPQISISGPDKRGLNLLLLKAGLLPVREVRVDVMHDREKIGHLAAIHRSQNIYFYGASLLIIGLIFCIAILVLHLYQARTRLEERVLERTVELERENAERRRTEDRLRESEERFGRSLEAARVGMWDLDLQTNTAVVNESWAAIVGYTLQELEPVTMETWNHLVHPEDLPRFELEFQKHLSGEADTYECEVRLRHKSGRWIHVLDRGRLFERTEDGHPSRVIGTEEDISERREMEERLRQSEKMQAIGQLAGGIAHDFNNQLSGILGYAEMLARKLDDQKLAEYAARIQTAAERSAELTSQLLAFGRKGKNLSRAISVNSILDEATAILEHSIDKRITIRKDLKAGPAMTMGDPSQLQNALLNTALNARDAMANGGEITFRTEHVVLNDDSPTSPPLDIPPGAYVMISISDTGTGMDAETQKRIFEPFFTTKDVGKGTGMGLASVYGIVHNHNGAISVCSEPGKGSTFTIYLPRFEGGSESEETSCMTAPTRGNARVLLVDDEEILRCLGEEMLKELGYSVTTCCNGREAVEHYRRHWQEIDLVILDMVMPELNGKDTFALMRTVNPNIKVILSSGYSIDGESQAILDDGVLAFVGKPFKLLELSEEISATLRTPTTEHQATSSPS
ncbi:MAG: hybrid sensor histidine kinase/response regulator [Planctomycetota bacterium]|jgi:PAS domain S-box-containing protein